MISVWDVTPWLIALVTLALLVITNIRWAKANTDLSSTLQSQAQGFMLMDKLNQDVNARVAARIKIINSGQSSLPISDEPPEGELRDFGSGLLSFDQPTVTTTRILSEADEINRELRRKINPNADYVKREAWGGGYEVEDA